MWICCKLRCAHWSHSQSRFTENYLHASVDLTRFDFLLLLLRGFFLLCSLHGAADAMRVHKNCIDEETIYCKCSRVFSLKNLTKDVFFPLNLILDFFLCSIVYLTLKRNNIFETTFLRVLHKVHQRATALKHFLCFLPASHTQ